ncbi:hypothetical protein DV515_00000813 [Chloebia gouldiae]|uniref:Uncharacterized protein n=1 Tax=Chloebia gouldiae TaxID=44316 RepID=A0A3L8T080_CHLGU|nr:hypothetical protein DV515_00000813 [Chloebia gouldiae]
MFPGCAVKPDSSFDLSLSILDAREVLKATYTDCFSQPPAQASHSLVKQMEKLNGKTFWPDMWKKFIWHCCQWFVGVTPWLSHAFAVLTKLLDDVSTFASQLTHLGCGAATSPMPASQVTEAQAGVLYLFPLLIDLSFPLNYPTGLLKASLAFDNVAPRINLQDIMNEGRGKGKLEKGTGCERSQLCLPASLASLHLVRQERTETNSAPPSIKKIDPDSQVSLSGPRHDRQCSNTKPKGLPVPQKMQLRHKTEMKEKRMYNTASVMNFHKSVDAG